MTLNASQPTYGAFNLHLNGTTLLTGYRTSKRIDPQYMHLSRRRREKPADGNILTSASDSE